MAKIKADADALDAHAAIHERIARYYRTLANDLESHGGPVVQAFYQTGFNDDDAGAYQRWLNFEQLYQQAANHDQQAQYFHDRARIVRQVEHELS